MKRIWLTAFSGLVLFFLVISNAYASNFKQSGQCSAIPEYTVSVAIKQIGHPIIIQPKTICFLVGNNHMTLYYLEGETSHHLLCKSDKCLQEWPIFYSKNIYMPRCLSTKDFTTFQRSDGKMQIAYDNHPLYYFAGDKKEGDVLGNKLKTPFGVWHIITIHSNK